VNELLSILVVVATLLLTSDFMITNFRKNIKQGDQVGVRFGDYVVNREVVRITDEFVAVKDLRFKTIVEVKINDVFMPDRFSPRDEAIEVEDGQ
jgi:hypothetical protein